MASWTTHYGNLVEEDFSGILAYIRHRGNYVSGRLPLNPDRFTVASAALSADGTEVVVSGEAGIGIKEIFVDGGEHALTLKWSSPGSGQNERFYWRASVSPAPGSNTQIFQAHDFKGNLVGSVSTKVDRSRR